MENSGFQFKNFNIHRSLIEVQNDEDLKDISISFKTGGKLYYDKGLFLLNLNVSLSDKNNILRIEVDSSANFQFENIKREDLNNYLFTNAPAILFPYIRAYISTLTTLSGLKSILLPTLNLSNLSEELEASIEEN